MDDYEKIVCTALISFGCGVASTVLIEKWRDRRELRASVLESYLDLIAKEGVDADGYLRFAALQKAGAWKLNQRELEAMAQDVCGRGYRHPYDAWRKAFPRMQKFPRDFLLWAKAQHLDLGDADAAVRKITEAHGASDIPKPPGPGFFFA